MAEREKVIKGLECCRWSRQNVKPEKNRCDECPYKDQGIINAFSVWKTCTNVLVEDVLVLLKEQKQAAEQLRGGYIENLITTAIALKLKEVSLPTDAALEMVRRLKTQETIIWCKDCKYWHDSIRCQMYSEGLETPDDWFCADGKGGKVE